MLFAFLFLFCGCSDKLDGTYESDSNKNIIDFLAPNISYDKGPKASEYQRQMRQQEKQFNSLKQQISDELSSMTKIRIHFSGNKVTFDLPGYRITEKYKIEDGNVLIANSPLQGRLEILSDGSLAFGPLIFRKMQDGSQSQTKGSIDYDGMRNVLFLCLILIVLCLLAGLICRNTVLFHLFDK